jgi:predicted amidohydrolase
MTRRAFASALAALWFAACASPPSPRVERAQPPPSAVWISDVAVVDVAKGERTPARDVLVANGRIAAITRAGAQQPPTGALVLSGKGATLVPGLVDMHGHVYADTHPIWSPGLPDPETNLRAYLYCGVTTVFDPGDNSSDAFERRERVARVRTSSPRVRSTPRPRATRSH